MHRTTLGIAAALVLLASAAQAQSTWSDGRIATVEFRRDTRVASTVLTPGVYQFQHQVIDGRDSVAVYVTTRAYVPGHHYYGAVVDEIARVPCRVIAVQSEQLDTTVYTRPDAGGIATVVRIVFRGEKAMHIIASERQP